MPWEQRLERRRQMISNQILQNTIDGLKSITRTDFCVYDTEGSTLAGTSPNMSGYGGDVVSFVGSPAASAL